MESRRLAARTRHAHRATCRRKGCVRLARALLQGPSLPDRCLADPSPGLPGKLENGGLRPLLLSEQRAGDWGPSEEGRRGWASVAQQACQSVARKALLSALWAEGAPTLL